MTFAIQGFSNCNNQNRSINCLSKGKSLIVKCEDLNSSFAKIISNKKQSREGIYPRFEYTKDQALQVQLEALQNNNVPYNDHGIEVLYRFASFDPWTRCRYFGKSQDMGQFERFRRMFHGSVYSALLSHTQSSMKAALQVSETSWMQNVQIVSVSGEIQTYSFFMVQRVGGRRDGYWFTERLLPTQENDVLM
eukprot:TRINITY_DN16938_c0_g1_i2.p2 TRINITY_DN16938_c0_g1~~TRINITY_DN16938_c0_g1_i2.p2  ORF type:complete len:192 (-),score=9.04 TRINITY_DN16938_c0_g1_i2:130-705(-)